MYIKYKTLSVLIYVPQLLKTIITTLDPQLKIFFDLKTVLRAIFLLHPFSFDVEVGGVQKLADGRLDHEFLRPLAHRPQPAVLGREVEVGTEVEADQTVLVNGAGRKVAAGHQLVLEGPSLRHPVFVELHEAALERLHFALEAIDIVLGEKIKNLIIFKSLNTFLKSKIIVKYI